MTYGIAMTMRKIFSRITWLSVVLLTVAQSVLAEATTLTNPISANSADELAATIIKVVLGSVGSVALLVIIYGGVELLISAGNQERVDKGRKALMWAALGLLVVFSSYGITRAFFAVLSGEAI